MTQPLKNNVLIKPDPKEEITKGGIIVPNPSQHNHKNGTIVAIGELVDEVSVGDRVKYENGGVEEDGHLLISVERVVWVY